MVVTSFAYFPSKRSVEVVLRFCPVKGWEWLETSVLCLGTKAVYNFT